MAEFTQIGQKISIVGRGAIWVENPALEHVGALHENGG